MISIVESEVETARPLEIRQRHAGVGVVLLGEHALWEDQQLPVIKIKIVKSIKNVN